MRTKIIQVDESGTPHEIVNGPDEPVKMCSNFNVFAQWCNDRYFVLASNEGDLFDTLDTNNNLFKKDRERGGMFWRLKACSKQCYDSYTEFLRSKSRTPFIVAQRRFRSDF